jgi:hypothetical protein
MSKLVLIAGLPSHPPGAHEHRAGMLLLQRCLAGVPSLEVEVHAGGWVADDAVLRDADAVAIFADGGGKHPLVAGDHLDAFAGLVAERGIGLGLMHYAVELPEGPAAERVDAWVGGHYQDRVSCNPIWEARVEELPRHPVARGVGPFTTRDEWYFDIQFGAGLGDMTPILVATPSDAVREGPYVHPQGPYPHIVEAAGWAETLMWAFERTGGGRGFGVNGGHFHANWGNDSFRTAVLNALVWIAGLDVPEGGVPSAVSEDELARNLDDKPPRT